MTLVQMCEKITCYNLKLDLVNMNAYIKFGEKISVSSQDIERKRNFVINQGPLLWYKCAKMMCNNPKLDLAKMNAYIKLGEIVPICSRGIKWKPNFSFNKGP